MNKMHKNLVNAFAELKQDKPVQLAFAERI